MKKLIILALVALSCIELAAANYVDGSVREVNENAPPVCGGYDVVSFGTLPEAFEWITNQHATVIHLERRPFGVVTWAPVGDFFVWFETDDLAIDVARIEYECGTQYFYRAIVERLVTGGPDPKPVVDKVHTQFAAHPTETVLRTRWFQDGEAVSEKWNHYTALRFTNKIAMTKGRWKIYASDNGAAWQLVNSVNEPAGWFLHEKYLRGVSPQFLQIIAIKQ